MIKKAIRLGASATCGYASFLFLRAAYESGDARYALVGFGFGLASLETAKKARANND